MRANAGIQGSRGSSISGRTVSGEVASTFQAGRLALQQPPRLRWHHKALLRHEMRPAPGAHARNVHGQAGAQVIRVLLAHTAVLPEWRRTPDRWAVLPGSTMETAAQRQHTRRRQQRITPAPDMLSFASAQHTCGYEPRGQNRSCPVIYRKDVYVFKARNFVDEIRTNRRRSASINTTINTITVPLAALIAHEAE